MMAVFYVRIIFDVLHFNVSMLLLSNRNGINKKRYCVVIFFLSKSEDRQNDESHKNKNKLKIRLKMAFLMLLLLFIYLANLYNLLLLFYFVMLTL